MKPETESIDLELSNAHHDKVFRAWLLPEGPGWVLKTEWGPRCAGKLSTQTKPDSPTTYDAAKKLYDRKLHEKVDTPCSCCGARYSIVGQADAPKLDAVPVKAEATLTEIRWRLVCPAPARQPETIAAPASWAPQLLQPVEEGQEGRFLADDRYGAQKKYDGVCISLWYHQGAKPRCFNKLGQLRAVPDYVLRSIVAHCPAARSWWLHGELMPNGGPLVVHDVMEWNDDMRGNRYENRLGFVAHQLYGCANIEIAELVTGTTAKRAFLAAQRAARGEGIVFKLRAAPYLPGRTQHWKLKFWASATCQIVSKRKPDGKDSYAIALRRSGRLQEVGTVSAIGKPAANVGALVEVKYLYIGHGGRMVQAELLGLRDDQPGPDDWTTLKLKDSYDERAS